MTEANDVETPEDQGSAPSHCCKVHRDSRFSRAIYVVEHDHAIEYAGQSFMAARSKIRGLRSVCVWMDGECMGHVDSEGEWTFKTAKNPSA